MELPYLARFAELGFLDDLKESDVDESMDTLEELVRFVYVSKPLENVNLRLALSTHAAREFRSDAIAVDKVMRESFRISPDFGYEVALALLKPAKRRGR